MPLVDERTLDAAFRHVQVSPRGFRYGFLSSIFTEEAYERLVEAFPPVESFHLVDKFSGGGRKHFFTGPLYEANRHSGCVCHLADLPEVWGEALIELASPSFVARLSTATGVSFNSPCGFGFTYGNEGCVQEPHLDGAVRPEDTSKIKSSLACLIYMNRNPDGPGATCIYDPDRKTVLYQVPSMRNGLFFFEQHQDAWHGFPQIPRGHERRLISVTFSQEAKPGHLKNSVLHRLTCRRRLKAMFR